MVARLGHVQNRVLGMAAVLEQVREVAWVGFVAADAVGGSFRDDASLPTGADTISLVRVLYDHADATVADLLRKVNAALPAGGRVVVSEPMAGGETPTRTGDAYFAFYTMAMQTGRARSAREIGDHLARAGFVDVEIHTTYRPFVTSVVSARKPA